MAGDTVRVAVRVRPLNRREIELGTKCVVEIKENKQQAILRNPTATAGSHAMKQVKSFSYDHCFWSFDEADVHYADQSKVYKCLGEGVLENAFKGYNACVFAYGQTGSGKSYTMMGSLGDDSQKGLIPRICEAMFRTIEEQQRDDRLVFAVEVSYMEIYNEKVRDLLDPKSLKRNLRVREHNIFGPYVDGLSTLAVNSITQIVSLMEEGNKSRTVAATNMNEESSRSHGVFSIVLTQIVIDEQSGVQGEKVSKIGLVDLAGSERAQKSGAVGKRLEEGANINKSLTTLGMVISALADRSADGSAGGKFVPYRDSVLTWLLKDSLGGNSKTVMVATVSPAADNYEETLSTLRYADRAKRIENHAVVNEDPNAKIIRELKEQVESLKAKLVQANQTSDLGERLMESEKLMADMSRTWEEKLRETELKQQERHEAMERMGISVEVSGIKVENSNFYLVNLNADPSMNELLVYYIKGNTMVGRPVEGTGHRTAADGLVPAVSNSEAREPDIQLRGLGVMAQHALFTIEDGKLFLQPKHGARTCVNGAVIGGKTRVLNGYRILIGNNHFFRANCPKEAGEEENVVDYEEALSEVIQSEAGDNNPITSAVALMEHQYKEKSDRAHAMEKEKALEQQRQVYERHIRELKSIISPMTPMPNGPNYGLYGACGGRMAVTPSSLPCFPNPRSIVQTRFVEWAKQRDESFKKSIAKLKSEVVRANALVREANSISAALDRRVSYGVTLAIPAHNLRPSVIRRGTLVSEPAVFVRRRRLTRTDRADATVASSQIWSLEKLENKLIDMRDVYHQECCSSLDGSPHAPTAGSSSSSAEVDELFFESQESHCLIGVANAFLEVLLHHVQLDYRVPIISQQGEVSGRLHVQIYRVDSDDAYECLPVTSPQSPCQPTAEDLLGKSIICRIRIKNASGLPSSLSNFVFCRYQFWRGGGVCGMGNGDGNQSRISAEDGEGVVVVPPVFDPNETIGGQVHPAEASTFNFDHEKVLFVLVQDFQVTVTEEFLEYVQEEALSIEVWGHRTTGPRPLSQQRLSTKSQVENTIQKAKTIQERWAEVIRRVQLWCSVFELNDQGRYCAVEVTKPADVIAGGVFQLKQGQQRRIKVRVSTCDNADDREDAVALPLICSSIVSALIGSITARNKSVQKPLDSYQEADLDLVKHLWNCALQTRRCHLDEQIQKLLEKPDKTEEDLEREQSLIGQWVVLTEERNAVFVPATNSTIPGAPSDWSPPPGVERHIPVLFLNMKTEDITSSQSQQLLNDDHLADDRPRNVAGFYSMLPKEHDVKMFNLPMLNRAAESAGGAEEVRSGEAEGLFAWDSSLHEHEALNRLTVPNHRVYAVLRVVVRLSHPADMDVVLRKRLCFNVYKQANMAEKFMRRLVAATCSTTDKTDGCGICYDVVGHIPKSSFDVEDRSSLALIAAKQTNTNEGENDADECRAGAESAFGESYIEKYTKGISAVESILALDRLRQEVAIRELLQRRHLLPATCSLGSDRMKRAASLPSAMNTAAAAAGVPTVVNPPEESGGSKQMENGSAELLSSSSLTRPSFLNLKPFYSGKLSSAVVSPSASGTLAVLSEENHCEIPAVEEEATARHDTKAHRQENGAIVRLDDNGNPNMSRVQVAEQRSVASSGYGSQLLGSHSEENESTPAVTNEVAPAQCESSPLDVSSYSDYNAKLNGNDSR